MGLAVACVRATRLLFELTQLLLKQCEIFHLGKWAEHGEGGLKWEWANKYPTTRRFEPIGGG